MSSKRKTKKPTRVTGIENEFVQPISDDNLFPVLNTSTQMSCSVITGMTTGCRTIVYLNIILGMYSMYAPKPPVLAFFLTVPVLKGSKDPIWVKFMLFLSGLALIILIYHLQNRIY